METIMEVSHLHKRFGQVEAVRDLSFQVQEGQLFAFLGINGAGKSTTINILCGQLAKDSGTVIIDGKDLDHGAGAIKRELGVVFQHSVLDGPLSVWDNLESRAALYDITGADFRTRLGEISQLLELEPILKRRLDKLSGGQRRRVDIARALLHRPRLLILDEPTTGLDPQTRKNLWRVIHDLRRDEGMTVFLTTHYMEEAADADHVVIIDSGSLVAQGSPLELKNAWSADRIALYGVSEAEVQRLGVPYSAERDGWLLTVPDTAAATELILAHPALFRDYEITKGRMDDVFLAVTGKKLTGGGEQ